MRAAPVKLFVSVVKKMVLIGDFKYTPTYPSLLSLFFKAGKNPPIEHGAFPGRSNEKTDQARTVTNVFCLAPCLLGPTF